MATNSGDPARHAQTLEGAMDEALAGLPDGTVPPRSKRWTTGGSASA